MFGLRRTPPPILVRRYHSERDFERAAIRLYREGYQPITVMRNVRFGVPTLTHGIIHTNITVTYSLRPSEYTSKP